MFNFSKEVDNYLEYSYDVKADKATTKQLYNAVSKAALKSVKETWESNQSSKRACYLSAEFLVGRLVYNNLLSLGLLEEASAYLEGKGLDPKLFEEIEDDALGNGGLGRLAACFLDSAASHNLPLDGYGIYYKYGLFKQHFENGFQKETADDWQAFGDPWSVRKEAEAVIVEFADQKVKAVPYDMPVIGYGGKTVNTLRLWEAEAAEGFDFNLFNDQKYTEVYAERNKAEDISAVLYPNDNGRQGHILRLKQQYFFSSATLKDIVRKYTAKHGADFSQLTEEYAVQLNDTHPVVAIPELMRILTTEYNVEFEKAFKICENLFAYTNHTVMAEALEKWAVDLFEEVIPEVLPFVIKINERLVKELETKGIKGDDQYPYLIIKDNLIHMANLAIYAGHSVNGVAQIHTEIIKATVLNQWYKIYPERFVNKTNGITQRRWLALCNKELSAFVTEKVGKGWITELHEIKGIEPFISEDKFVEEFMKIKRAKKVELVDYIKKQEGVELNPDFVFDIQIKRLHEYKRQLLNAFGIIDLYFQMKDGKLKDFAPTVFLFGAKAAPGYMRAKGIIKFINEISNLVNNDPEVNDRMKVLFVHNYNVSYAEKLIPAADISEQISTAGTEASGTGNMKFMLNGAVTLGTLDGANVEIVEQAGLENNYIFGATVEEIEALEKYDSMAIYNSNPRIKKVVDTLIDGTFSDEGTGVFKELHDSLLLGASWHEPDHYKLLLDLESYVDARIRSNEDTKDKMGFARKCLYNIANAGKFSSDRTIKEYFNEIWGVEAK